ncbi:Putative Gdt1 family protein [Septoria linicola]|uniref:Gdt1 family protein n=1 Tax=Septoria linicola TaxID=215465 RepID=A0A9Q9ATS3_9PEZI|nr:putative Gdt1 family protein [Septoria linicola]USW55672.1 Putative Gdt1 family protein [Septoria linicola]
MRIRRASPLLLLLAPSLVAAQNVQPAEGTEVLSNDEILALNRIKGADSTRKTVADAAAVAPPNAKTTRIYKGTEDAPVDGLDGKPHAGPFVDRPAEAAGKKGDAGVAAAKAKPTSLSNFGDQDIPEKNDGVMNDNTRTPPKKGTTGTEGGISEKTKDRETEKRPQTPQKAPPLPHSKEQDIESSVKEKPANKYSSEDDTDAITGERVGVSKKAADYGEAGYGLEKPANLPPKPHNIPHPDVMVPTTGTSDDFGPPVNPSGGRDKWLVDTMPDTEGKTNLKPQKPGSGSGSGSGSDSTSTPATSIPVTRAALDKSTSDMEWHEWFHSFGLSFTMIIFSEIGDKTFLVAALMAMRHARLLVFSAAISALIAMTVLSAVLGHAFPALLPKTWTTFAAAILFFVFGAKSLREGLAMPKDAGIGEEMREVEAELEEKEHSMRQRKNSKSDHSLSAYELESGRGRNKGELSPPLSRSPSPPSKRGGAGLENLMSLVLSPAWVQTFIMTFLGEWGDRSQIATIAMAAGQDYWLVTLGAIVGHACCTGVAVLGGRALAGRVSMRVVTIGGAVAFLVFGCIYLYECLAG